MTLTNEPAIRHSATERIWNALELGGYKPQKRRGDSFMALCPVHGDTHPSLSVKYDRGREAVLLHCFTCEARFDDILATIGLSPMDAFDAPLPERAKDEQRSRRPAAKPRPPREKLPARMLATDAVEIPNEVKWEKVTTYPYFNEDGTLVEEVIREHAVINGVVHKRFRQRFRSANGRMVNNKPDGFQAVLFHHAEVLSAIEAGSTVWLLEGEKDVETAKANGLIATTNAQGAGSFPIELASVFTSAKVAIVADRDTAGFKRATMLHETLTHVGAAVELFQPAVTDDKSDLTDHFEAGHTVGELIPLTVDEARLRGQLGEIRRAAILVDVARDEAAERMRHRFGEDEHFAAARAWAREAAARFERVVALCTDVDQDAPFPDLIQQLHDTIRTTAVNAESAHVEADLPTPPSISRFSTNTAVVTRIGGDDQQPPRFSGNELSPDDDGSPNEGTHFMVRHGETVQVRRERDGDGYRNRYHRVMRGWAEVQHIYVDEDGTDTDITRATDMLVIKFSRWVRNELGKVVRDVDGLPEIEEKIIRWDADQLRDGSWAQAMPWPKMLESTSRRGKDTAWDSIFTARPVPAQRSHVYTTTGWRKSDLGDYFVHAGGTITPDGFLSAETRFGGGVQHLRLAEPSQDSTTLRAAWFEGTATLRDALPARVIAPLLGLVWESPFAPVPLVTYLHGAPGAGKTACARQAMHYFAPDLRQAAGSTKTILSATTAGGSSIGHLRVLSTASDLPVLVDDFVDTDVKKAEAKLESLARSVFDRAPRVTGKQRGGVTEQPPINASVIATGQIGVHGSALQRLFTIGMYPGEVENPAALFDELETKPRRTARAQLGAALVQWLAKNRQDLKAEYFNEDTPGASSHTTLSRNWYRRIADLPHTEGAKGRMAMAGVAAAHGIQLMLRMLVENGALTSEEGNEFYTWAADGIHEAIRRQDGGAGDPAITTIELIREALAANTAHLTMTDGAVPRCGVEPGQLGWSLRGAAPHETFTAMGPRIGNIRGEGPLARLLLYPRVTYDVVSRIANAVGESLSDTITSIGSSFLAHGWIAPDGSGNNTVGRRVDGTLVRVWDIPLDVLLGDTDSDGTDTPGSTPPAPPLFDAPQDTGSNNSGPQTINPPPPMLQTPSDAATDDTQLAGLDESTTATPKSSPLIPSTSTPTPTVASPGPARAIPTFRAAAAVLHTDGVWLPDGERVELAKPIEHLGDVAKLIASLRLGNMNRWKTEDGQLFVTAEAAKALGIPVDQLPKYDTAKALQRLTVDHPLILGAIEAGFEIGGKERSLNATTRIWHSENSRELRGRFVLIPALGTDFAHILEGNPDPATIARRLQRFTDALGATYTISASTTGLDLMQVLHWKQREELFAPSRPVPPAEISTLEADIDWQRTPTETEAAHRWVHAYDRGGSYLAGVSGLELGIGPSTYFPDGHEFDKRLPGYWRITMPEKAEWLTPNPIDPRNRDITGQLTWLTTPTLDVAMNLGYEPTIHEAYVWEKHSRIYDTWYERIRDARTSLDTIDPDDQHARDLLKELYVRTLGLTASFEHHQGRPGFAPERYHFIQARAKANIIRRIQQIGVDTGRWPVAISKDTVLYTSDDANPAEAWPGKPEHFGRGLGQYKYEGTATLTEHLKFLTGQGRYEGKSSLEVFI